MGRHEVSADTHLAHVGFNTIEFIYRRDVNGANSVVNRVFHLVRVEKRGMYTVVFVSDGTKAWEIKFEVSHQNHH